MAFKKTLRTRIPEVFQDNENLDLYLETAGELLDEILEAIKEHDTYKDYKTVAERRLSILLNRYGLRLSNKLPPEILRMIVRDITTIYNTNGTHEAIDWAMRLIGLDYRIEKAWLIDPHLYLPGVGDPSGEGRVSPFDLPERGLVYLNILPPDRAYKIGRDAQLWDEDNSFLIIGTPKIGVNQILEQGAEETGDPVFDAAMREREFNFDRIGYKNFVYGEAVDDDDGVFFYGRTFNTTEQNVQKLRIIGEKYPQGAFNSDKVVVATPYIALFVDDFDLDYVDDLDGKELSFADKVEIFNYLYDHIFIDTTKASPVVLLDVINIGNREEEEIAIDTSLEFSFSHEDIRKTSDLLIGDELTISKEITIPEVGLVGTASCYIDSDECRSDYVHVGDSYTIGQVETEREIEGRVYFNDRGIAIGLNTWCMDNAFRYSGIVNLNWNAIEGIDGYHVYRKKDAFDENSLPVPHLEIEDEWTSFYDDVIDDDTSYYYAVGAFFDGHERLSEVIQLGVEGCHPPIEPFTATLESGCENQMKPFSVMKDSFICNSILEAFSIESDEVDCLSNLVEFGIKDSTVDCDSVLENFSITSDSYDCRSVMTSFSVLSADVDCNSILEAFSIESDEVDCRSSLVAFSVTSGEVDCLSVLEPFTVNDSSVECSIQCVTHSISIGDGYEIGQTGAQSHRHASLFADELKIGSNTFCRS